MEVCMKDRDAFPRHAPRNKAVRHGMVEPDLEAYRGSSVFVRARPGRSGGLSVPWRFPPRLGCVWRFCIGAQGD